MYCSYCALYPALSLLWNVECGKAPALHMRTKKNGTIVDCTQPRRTPEPNNRTLHGYDESEVVSAFEILNNFEQSALIIRRSRPISIQIMECSLQMNNRTLIDEVKWKRCNSRWHRT